MIRYTSKKHCLKAGFWLLAMATASSVFCFSAGAIAQTAQPQAIAPMPQPAFPDDVTDGEKKDAQTSPSPAAEVAPLAPLPSADGLAEPKVAADPQVPEIPNLVPAQTPDENLFFDADALVPAGEMGVKGGPRKVNPALEPASKYIVVTKDANAGSRRAQLVAAERAVSLGRYESALSIYDELYAKNKSDPNVLLGRAMAYQKLGQSDSAIQSYEEFLKFKPSNVEAQINVIGLMGKQYPAVALKRLSELQESNPNHPGVWAQLAMIHGEMGNYDEAVRSLGVAAGKEPHNPLHLFNMAVISDKAGNKANAIRYYEEALELDTVYGGGRSIPREAVFTRLAQIR